MNPKHPICNYCGGQNTKPFAIHCSNRCSEYNCREQKAKKEDKRLVRLYKMRAKKEKKVQRLIDICSYSSPQAIKELISLCA